MQEHLLISPDDSLFQAADKLAASAGCLLSRAKSKDQQTAELEKEVDRAVNELFNLE